MLHRLLQHTRPRFQVICASSHWLNLACVRNQKIQSTCRHLRDSVPKFLLTKDILGTWNNCPHPFFTRGGLIKVLFSYQRYAFFMGTLVLKVSQILTYSAHPYLDRYHMICRKVICTFHLCFRCIIRVFWQMPSFPKLIILIEIEWSEFPNGVGLLLSAKTG